MKIDFKSKDFKFIPRKDQFFLEGSECQLDTDCSPWRNHTIIEDGWGFFEGYTMITYEGYTGELPMEKEDSASFVEFDIFYKDLLVNTYTYESLFNLIQRDTNINKII